MVEGLVVPVLSDEAGLSHHAERDAVDGGADRGAGDGRGHLDAATTQKLCESRMIIEARTVHIPGTTT